LRWGLASQNEIGALTQGTVILARQQQQGEQERLHNQTGGFGQELGRNQTGGLIGQDLGRTKRGMFGQELGRSKTGVSGGFAYSQETQETRETASFIETTLYVSDIPRFIPTPRVQEEQLRRVACVPTAHYRQISDHDVTASTRLSYLLTTPSR